MPISPTVEGFRAAFRRPLLTLGEITWRWAVGATATALFFFGLLEYFDTLPLTSGEMMFLRTRHPYLVAEAIAHIFRGRLNRAVMASLLAAMMLALLWIVAASLGRMATVRSLLDYFRRDAASSVSTGGVAEGSASDASTSDVGARTAPENSPFHALIRINFLRLVVAIAAIFGFAGAAILAGFASPDTDPNPGLAFLLFVPLAGLICLAWWALNWLLSLAALFAVRDGEDAVGAISAAVRFWRERTGAVFAVSTWTGLAHLVVFVGATTVVSMPLGFAGVLPWRLIVLAVILVTLIYFALADWLYMARLAGYVCIAETPEALLAPLPMPPPRGLPVALAPPVHTTIDRDEPILSDAP
jgi:MFS family permease